MTSKFSPVETKSSQENKQFGITLLPNGEALLKSDKILITLGILEELSSHIGILRARYFPADSTSRFSVDISAKAFINARLIEIQENIHRISTSISTSKKVTQRFEQTRFQAEGKVKELEDEIETMGIDISKAKSIRFIPGSSEVEAEIFRIRSIVRKAERQIVSGKKISNGFVFDESIQGYLNKLGDYFLALAVHVLFLQNKTPIQMVNSKN